MPLEAIKAIEPQHLPVSPPTHCYCKWLARCCQRICDCFTAICRFFSSLIPRGFFERIITLLTPSKSQKLIHGFCERLTALSPEKRRAEFDNAGQALFFSLNSQDKYTLVKTLQTIGAETPYLQDLVLETQERFSRALDNGIKTLALEVDTTLMQDFLQNCLFELLIKGNASTAPDGFEKHSFVNQLQIIYYLYRIIYHSELTPSDKSDLYIDRLLTKLPESAVTDITSKAKSTTTKELCLVLINHYIQPAEDPAQTIRQACLKLFFCPPPCVEAIAPFRREVDCQI
jgi:hypothetical protein